MTKPNTSCTIEVPASLRSDGVRDHPGMPFGCIPDLAFGFVGIRTTRRAQSEMTQQAQVEVAKSQARQLPKPAPGQPNYMWAYWRRLRR